MFKRLFIIFSILFTLTACDEVLDEFGLGDILQSDDEVSHSSLDGLNVHFIDAGQGDATLFTYDDKVVLIDAGDWKNMNVRDYLRNEKIKKIDLVILTHPHSDHIGQIKEIADEVAINEIWMSGDEHTSKAYEKALQAILDHDITYHEPRSGEKESIGDLHLEVLHPETLTGEYNEGSISVRVTYGDIHLMFTGDAYKKNEAEMIKRHDHLQAHILQLGHHGSNTSTSNEFLDAVQPEIAIYSAEKDNMYGHPHREVVERVTSRDIELLGTAEDGTIIIHTDGKTYSVKTNQTSQPKEAKSKCIDINQASKADLMKIKHINEERANELIQLRPYDHLKQLKKIYGIGDGRLKDIEKEGLACVS